MLRDKILLSHTLVHMTSFQCAMFLEVDRPLTVLCSGAGWYIGARKENGSPLARDSEEYWGTQHAAQEVLEKQSWTQRLDC